MGALTRVGLAALVVAAAAVAGVLLLGRSESPPALAATAPLVVHAGFDPPTVTFGDRVVARVVVLLDRSVVRPRTLKLTADVAPLTQLAAPVTTRAARGDVSVVTYEVPAACMTQGCISPSGDLKLRLPHVIASVATRSGGVTRTAAPWPVLHVHGRVNAGDLAGSSPPLPRRCDSGVADVPDRARRPSRCSSTCSLYCSSSAASRSPHARCSASPGAGATARPRAARCERALRLAREAESRPPPDRRRALGAARAAARFP